MLLARKAVRVGIYQGALREKAWTLCRLGIPADGIDDISSLRPPTLRLLVVSISHPTNRFPSLRQSFSHHAISRTPGSTTVGLQTKMIGGVHEQNPQMDLTNQECSATEMHCCRHCIPILMMLLNLGNLTLAQFCRWSSYVIHTLRWGFYNFDHACIVHFD